MMILEIIQNFNTCKNMALPVTLTKKMGIGTIGEFLITDFYLKEMICQILLIIQLRLYAVKRKFIILKKSKPKPTWPNFLLLRGMMALKQQKMKLQLNHLQQKELEPLIN